MAGVVGKVLGSSFGEQLKSERTAKLFSLRKLIYGVLSANAMTTKELVGCLMSEPYNIEYDDLDLVVVALNGLNSGGLLRASFRKTNDVLSVDAVFRTTPSKGLF